MLEIKGNKDDIGKGKGNTRISEMAKNVYSRL
jgi:hypothetical protein